MNLFKIENGKVTVTPEALLIKAFADIWNRDNSAKKEFAIRELGYIYFMCDYNSVYQSYPEEERKERLRNDLSKHDSNRIIKLSKYCEAGIKKYKELQNTPTMDFLESVKNAMVNMTDYFNNVNFKERDSKGVPIYKPEIVTRCAKDAGGIVDSIDKLKAKIKVEIYESDMARGKSQINPFEV